jgi:hypothetical protein
MPAHGHRRRHPASTRPTPRRHPVQGLATCATAWDAVGGTLEVASLQRAGTTVTAVVPRTEAMRGHEALSFEPPGRLTCAPRIAWCVVGL